MVDREGRVRVVDFGLAQAVAEASAEESSQGSAVGLTATGALMGTPAYMAPEQFQGRPTDARTDVFAFCVALYEHLHGERPFAGETLVTLAAEVTAGRVREAPRGARVPKAIRRVLMKGLALAPEGRYPSMSALLADLDEAVRAPRRRRAALGVGAALAATIGAGSAFVLAEDDALARCQQSSAMIGEVWSPAAREAGARAFAATGLPYAADAWSRAEARLDGWAKGWAAARDGACVDGAEAGFSAALRDRRLACFDRQRARVEALVEVLAGADVKLVERTGELVDGLPGPRECSAAVMASAGDGPAAPTEAQAAAVEGLRRRLAAASTRFAATFGEAEVAAIEALVMEARGLGYRPLVAEAAGLCADAHAQLLHVDEAERLFVEALAEAEAVGDTRLVATLWPQWIRFLVMGRSAIAEARHADRRADALLERIGGDEEVAFEVGKARVGLLNAVGEVNEAIAVGKATLELGARLFGEGSLRVADVENIVGGIMLAARAEGADAMLRRAFAVWERGLGPDHPKIAIAIFNLAREATVRDDYVEAERLFREALARFERIDPDHPHIGATINNLAGVYDYRDEPEKALVEYRRALEHLRRTRGEEHAMTAHAYLNVGSGEMRAGDLTAARRDIEAGLRIRRAIFGEGSVKVLSAEGILLDLLVDEDDRPAARALADRILASIGDEDSLELESVFVSLAEERLLDGRAEEAVALAERGLRSHAEGDKPPYDVNFALARALAATGGDRARARALAEASMTYWSRWPRFMAPELAVGRRFLAELDEAERLRR